MMAYGNIHRHTRREALQLAAAVAGFMLTGCTTNAAKPGGNTRFNFEAAADYSRDHFGHSFLVYQGGDILFERYEDSFTPDDAIHMASATKSFWGIAAAKMAQEGLLDFDEPAHLTLTEWKNDPDKSKITLRHLLNLSSGLAEDIPGLQGYKRRETWVRDKYLHAIGLGVVSAPGSRFRYGPSHFYVLGEIFKRKLGRDPLIYLDDKILRPIGCEYSEWIHDDAGNAHIPNGCYITARNWLKFGRLVMNEGRYRNQQLVDSRLVGECLAPSEANPGYGLTWWLNREGGFSSRRGAVPNRTNGGFIYHGGQRSLVAAMGAGPNRMYLFPDLDMIMIRQLSQDDTEDRLRKEVREKPEGPGILNFSDNQLITLLLQS